MTDRELLAELLDSGKLSSTEQEAFDSMADWLDSREGRRLSAAQAKWVHAIALAKGIVAEQPQNLFSSGKVPVGIPTKKSDGERFAADVLNQRPTSPPGRRSA